MPSETPIPAIILNSTICLFSPSPPAPITPEHLAEILTLTNRSISAMHKTLTSLTTLLNAAHYQHTLTLQDARSYHSYLTTQALALRCHAEKLIELDTEEYFWEWVELRNRLHAISDGPGAGCAELVERMEGVYWKWADGVWEWIRRGWEDVRRAEGVVRGVLECAGRRGWWFGVREGEEGGVYYFAGQGAGEEKVMRQE
ncbi:hypothetical protein B9Z19DRAFT_1139887 [Tuber borchii]|uniref:Uncharacterized protein n=1 Tax=Tuber borchii TaxID=42251 RepID=A0A2T7A9C2_TUBBO|nr:hypothetical protein B9Z19DRAFT_1139887 [Tuber borchii]